MLDIVDIVLDMLVHRLLPAVHLPPAGQAGLDQETAALPRLVTGRERQLLRAWTDKTHLPAQDSEKLRELVKTGAAKELPDPRHAAVTLNRLGAKPGNIHIHGAKFQELEN